MRTPSRFMAAAISLVIGLALSNTAVASSSKAMKDWNMRYKVPSGWSVVRVEGRLVTYQNAQNNAQLYIAPGMSNTPEKVQTDLIALGSALSLQGQPTENLHHTTLAGRKTIQGSYELFSTYLQKPLRGRSIAVLSDHGTALGMLVVAHPEGFEHASESIASIVSSVKIGPPKVNKQAIGKLAGTWSYYGGGSSRISGHSSSSRSYEETLYFDGQGHYRWNSSSHVSSDSLSSGSSGYESSSGGVSSFGSNASQGTYTVIGNQIVITTNAGQTVTFDYLQTDGKMIAGGKTFLRE